MRQLTLAGITLAMLTFAAPLSTAKADNHWGPIKVGDQCWQRQGHNSLGYWAACKPEGRTANAAVRRGKR
jgi:hypothetical protein